MPLSRLSDPHAVIAALEEARSLGRVSFLKKYEFGSATKFSVIWNGEPYDSKAIAAVAYGKQFPSLGPLRRDQLSGGIVPTGAVTKLQQLGFEVLNTSPEKKKTSGHWIYYWTEYHENITEGAFLQLNQNSPAMDRIKPGDTIWAVTSNGRGHSALAARFLVGKVGANPPETREVRWGRRFFSSAPADVVYFGLGGQPNIGKLLYDIGLVKLPGRAGQFFQGPAGVRAVSDRVEAITEFAAALPIDTRLTADEAIEAWMAVVPYSPATVGVSTPARREQTREIFARNQAAVRELKDYYKGVCQITGKQPLNGAAGDITEAHHIEWLTRDGPDTTDNMVVLSPDWHRAIHNSDASFAWSDLSFTVNGRKVRLAVNKHLRPRQP